MTGWLIAPLLLLGVDAVSGAAVSPVSAVDETAEPPPPESDDFELIILDVEESPPSPQKLAAGPVQAASSRARFRLRSRVLLDSVAEDTGEDVVEWWSSAHLEIEHNPAAGLRAFAEATLRWGAVGEHPGAEYRFFGLNPRDRKWSKEVELRQAYLHWRVGGFELAVGQRIFVWGKNEVFAAADLLNPIDLRRVSARLLDPPKETKRPVFAADLSHWWGEWGLQMVFLPFFSANRGALLGNDFALAPPGTALERELLAVAEVDPSIEDELQAAVAGTEVPEEAPWHGSVALRGIGSVAGWDLAITAFYGWEWTPRLRVDPDLVLLAREAQPILANPELLLTQPELRDAWLGVQQKSLVGEELLRARYRRAWRFALEAQGVVGDLVTRADVGVTPGQVFYGADYRSVWRPSLTAALGAEYSRGEEWYVSLTGYSLVVFDAPAGRRLIGIEAADVATREGREATLYGLTATLRWREPQVGLEASATAAANIAPGDHFLTFEVAYDHFEPHRIHAGFLLCRGPVGTLGARYRRNDFVYLGYAGAW